MLLFAVALRIVLTGRAWVAAGATALCTLGVAAFPLDAGVDGLHAVRRGARVRHPGGAPSAQPRGHSPAPATGPWRRHLLVVGTISLVLLAGSLAGPSNGLLQRAGLGATDVWVVATAGWMACSTAARTIAPGRNQVRSCSALSRCARHYSRCSPISSPASDSSSSISSVSRPSRAVVSSTGSPRRLLLGLGLGIVVVCVTHPVPLPMMASAETGSPAWGWVGVVPTSIRRTSVPSPPRAQLLAQGVGGRLEHRVLLRNCSTRSPGTTSPARSSGSSTTSPAGGHLGRGERRRMARRSAERVLDADIVVLGTPIWLGKPSSVCQRVLERMDAFLGEEDDQGRIIS